MPKMRIAETQAAQRIGAYALTHRGKDAGRIHVLYPRDGAARLYLDVVFFAGRFKNLPRLSGSARGCGYCKKSAAFQNAMERGKVPGWKEDVGGYGWGSVVSALKKMGYRVIEVL